MKEKRYLQPGDRVRVTDDVADPTLLGCFPDQPILLGTQGSIGTVVSYEEFRAEQDPHGWRSQDYEGFMSTVKDYIEKNRNYSADRP